MAGNEEYNSLIQKKSRAQIEYSREKNRLEQYEADLRRLRRCKVSITETKGDFRALKKRDKKIVRHAGDNRSWEGSNFMSFKGDAEEMFRENENYYIHSLDFTLDSLNNEITRIENLISSQYGILGRCAALINSLSNQIENFFN